MLLVHTLVDVSRTQSTALVKIDESVPFYQQGLGVPAAVGVEYMGQAAALIAGFQQERGLLAEHLGVLLGVRNYVVTKPYFQKDAVLRISCEETAVVGDGLARFDCRIQMHDSEETLGTGKLSVFRQALQHSP